MTSATMGHWVIRLSAAVKHFIDQSKDQGCNKPDVPCPCMQAVFSRPVIALGSDFGKSDSYGGKARGKAVLVSWQDGMLFFILEVIPLKAFACAGSVQPRLWVHGASLVPLGDDYNSQVRDTAEKRYNMDHAMTYSSFAIHSGWTLWDHGLLTSSAPLSGTNCSLLTMVSLE